MAKEINMLKMLLLLRKNGMTQSYEIARILGVKRRMIRQYKKHLKEIGVIIGSKTGSNGGYYVEKDNFMLGVDFSKEEIETMMLVKEGITDYNLLHKYSVILEKFY